MRYPDRLEQKQFLKKRPYQLKKELKIFTRGNILRERGSFSPTFRELRCSRRVINPVSGGIRITL